MTEAVDIRGALKDRRQVRDNKLARVYAKPEQLTKKGEDIFIAPPGETVLAKAQREAKEARALADEARSRAKSRAS
jgi:hypothetical protein